MKPIIRKQCVKKTDGGWLRSSGIEISFYK